MKLKMVRNQALAENIALVDGMSRSGKSLVAPILSTFERGELWLLEPLFDYLCINVGLGKFKRDAASAMAQLHADLSLYNLSISRLTNMRRSDISGAHANLLGERHVTRLKAKEGDVVVARIQREKPILVLMMHYVFGASDFLFDAFRDRLKLSVVAVRHPLWLAEAWLECRWHERFDRDPRDLMFCCEVRGRSVPWFAHGWASKYRCLKPMDRTIHVVEYFMETFDLRFRSLSKGDKKKVLFIPFERFVTGPSDYVDELARRLRTRRTPLTGKMLRRLGVPRVLGEDHLEVQKDKFEKLLKKERAGAESRRILERLCRKYEMRYGKKAGKVDL